jgi:predicted nucleic acid-binding protein
MTLVYAEHGPTCMMPKNPDGSKRTFENNDRWIAACAIHHDIPLITHNRKHFEGTQKLKLISEAP